MIKYTKLLTKVIVLVVITSGLITGVIIGILFFLAQDLPEISALESYLPPQTTKIYSKEEILIAELFIEKREPVLWDEIPKILSDALLATEDQRFYQHMGIDLKGIIRAIVKDVMARKFIEGASTITQQLAKTLFLTSKKTIDRKLKEALLALQLEHRYTKNEILALYLNQVYFGAGAYGVSAAASIYFGKRLGELTVAECALIVGMLKAPSYYSPFNKKDRAINRRNLVLKLMMLNKVISKKDYETASQEPLNLAENPKTLNLAPYFVDYIKPQLERIMTSSLLYKGGFAIYSTLSMSLQNHAQKAIKEGLSDLKKRMEKNKIQSIKPQAALIALDVSTGGIISMIGGEEYAKSVFNRSTQALRQSGSAFKPIVYACAIENGYEQNDLILDAPVVYKGSSAEEDWRPENFSRSYMGEITLRRALALSKNIPAVRIADKLGIKKITALSRKLGITSRLSPYLSLSLGTSETNLLELTAAYLAFANHGEYIKPYGLIEIKDSDGRIIWHHTREKKLAVSKETAAIITDMLRAVILEGTGKKARHIPAPLAGKTGTTNSYKDALFVGYSPNVATGVWVGQDDFQTLGRLETGARASLPIWISYMSKAVSNNSNTYFDIPDGVKKVSMHKKTGKIEESFGKNTVQILVRKIR